MIFFQNSFGKKLVKLERNKSLTRLLGPTVHLNQKRFEFLWGFIFFPVFVNELKRVSVRLLFQSPFCLQNLLFLSWNFAHHQNSSPFSSCLRRNQRGFLFLILYFCSVGPYSELLCPSHSARSFFFSTMASC